MIKNLENSIKGKKKSKSDLISNEKLNNTVFNSKVYDSIINDYENCLFIFSNDKGMSFSLLITPAVIIYNLLKISE